MVYVGILLCNGSVFCEDVLYTIGAEGCQDKVSKMFGNIWWLVCPVVCVRYGVVKEDVGMY